VNSAVCRTLVKHDVVAHGIDGRQRQLAPRCPLEARARVSVIAFGQLTMELLDARRLDPHAAARSSVTMVFAEMKHAAAARYLHVERKFRLKTMFPVNNEAEEVDIKLACLPDVEHPKYRDDMAKGD